MNLKDKAIIIIDTGLFGFLAECFVGQFGRVMTFNPAYKTAFPSSNSLYIGDGIKGVERIEEFWNIVKEYKDKKGGIVFFFPDLHNGDLQSYLIGEGYYVFGSRRAEEIEIDRYKFKTVLLPALNMPVNKVDRVIGTNKLKEYLKKPENTPCYVKVTLTRADMESRKHFSYESSLLWIAELEHHHGPIASDMEFLCEKPISTTLEIGGDKWCIDGKYPESSLFGVEIKDCGYMCAIMKQFNMPEPVKYVDNKIAPVLQNFEDGFRGFISTEIRIGKDGKYYFLDPCIRLGNPPGQILSFLLENIGEVVWLGSQGIVAIPKWKAKYGVQAFLYSERCDKEFIEYKIEKGYEKFFKFSFEYREDGKIYTIPQKIGMSAMGSVLGIGDSPLEAIKSIVENSSKIEAESLDIRLDSITKAVKELHECKKKGYKFGDAPMVTLEQVARLIV